MSAYRELPPPRPFRLLYRPPARKRVGDTAFVLGSGVGTLLSIGVAVTFFLVGGAAGVVGLFALVAAMTSGTLFCIAWMTRLSEVAEVDVWAVLPEAPGHCRVVTKGERWALPIAAEAVQIGQTIRVQYRDVAPGSNAACGREIIAIHVAE